MFINIIVCLMCMALFCARALCEDIKKDVDSCYQELFQNVDRNALDFKAFAVTLEALQRRCDFDRPLAGESGDYPIHRAIREKRYQVISALVEKLHVSLQRMNHQGKNSSRACQRTQ